MKRYFCLLIIALIVVLSACGQPVGNEPVEQDEEILLLVGLTEEALELPVSELKKLEAVTGNANTIDSANVETTRSYKGVKVETVLAKFDLDLAGVTAIVVKAGDGYSTEIPQEILDVREIILAWELDGAPLPAKDAPLRMVVPEERTLYWVRSVAELEFIRNLPETVSEIRFFENLYSDIETQIYTYNGSEDKAVNIAQLVEGSEKVILVARDGLTKFETLRDDTEYFIKVEGEDSPLFISPSIPKGMYVKDLGLIIYGKKAIVFGAVYADGNMVDMAEVLTALSPYLYDGALTMNLPQGNVAGAYAELADLRLTLSEQGVYLE